MPGSCARGIDAPITGEPGNADHVHVVGKMFMETDADDETPGYLDEGSQLGENPGQPHTWIRQRVNDEPGGPEANDHELRIYHGEGGDFHSSPPSATMNEFQSAPPRRGRSPTCG